MTTFSEKLSQKIKKFQAQEKERAENKGSINTDPTRFPGFKQGDVVLIRLLPPKPVLNDDDVDFYKTLYYHSFRTAKNKEKWNFFTCPKNLSWDHECPFCDYVADVYQSFGSNNDYKNYKRKRSYIYNGYLVSFKNDKMDDDNPHVKDWESCIGQVRMLYFPYTVKNKIDDELKDSGASIFDPFDGYNLIVKCVSKTEKGDTYSDYSLTKFDKDKTAIAKTKKEINTILKETIDLSENIESKVISSEEVIKKAKMEGIIVTEVSLDAETEINYEMEPEDDVPFEETLETETPENPKSVQEEAEPEEEEAEPEKEETNYEDSEEDVDEIINKLNDMFEA